MKNLCLILLSLVVSAGAAFASDLDEAKKSCIVEAMTGGHFFPNTIKETCNGIKTDFDGICVGNALRGGHFFPRTITETCAQARTKGEAVCLGKILEAGRYFPRTALETCIDR